MKEKSPKKSPSTAGGKAAAETKPATVECFDPDARTVLVAGRTAATQPS